MTNRPLKVLLIEDDEATARALRVLFHQRAGMEVLWAATLEEGRALLPSSPDAILLDLMLPDGGGEDFLRDLAEGSWDGEKPRVVVVTALPETSARVKKAAALRPQAIIHKPYDVMDLMSAVKGEPPVQPPAPNPEPPR